MDEATRPVSVRRPREVGLWNAMMLAPGALGVLVWPAIVWFLGRLGRVSMRHLVAS